MGSSVPECVCERARRDNQCSDESRTTRWHASRSGCQGRNTRGRAGGVRQTGGRPRTGHGSTPNRLRYCRRTRQISSLRRSRARTALARCTTSSMSTTAKQPERTGSERTAAKKGQGNHGAQNEKSDKGFHYGFLEKSCEKSARHGVSPAPGGCPSVANAKDRLSGRAGSDRPPRLSSRSGFRDQGFRACG